MKSLLTLAALAALASSPAFAETQVEKQALASESYPMTKQAEQAVVANPNSVFTNGYYTGTDPDPTVRHDLMTVNPNAT